MTSQTLTVSGNDSLNRTFMELKYNLSAFYIATVFRLNRTFMELKLEMPVFLQAEATVLIEPLWN